MAARLHRLQASRRADWLMFMTSTVSPQTVPPTPSTPLHLPSALPADAADSADAVSLVELLDEPDEWEAFSRPVDGRTDVWESSVGIEGMHCAACALTVEDALRRIPGVQDAQVSPGSHRAKVVWSSESTRPSVWMQSLLPHGYRAVPANDAFAAQRRRKEARAIVWQWGVAGIAMMQIMMYAWPEYVSQDIGLEYIRILRWASWIIAVPLVIFSCRPFLRSAWLDVRHRRISMDLPVALGMLIAFVVSTAGTFNPQGVFGHEVYFDSLSMFVFFLLTGRWLEWRLRDRTAGALEALMNRLPESVQRRNKKGVFERVTLRRLKVGDVVRVLPGESFPGDGVLLAGRTLVDEALLTGESRPLARDVGALVIAGSHNIQSVVEMRIEQLGRNTRYAQIVDLMEHASVDKPRLAQFADRYARPFLVMVLLAAAMAVGWWWRTDPARALMVAVSVLIVTCPCALSLATPAAMLAAAGNLARQGVLVRRLQALEALAQVDTVVFDKTGTLTADSIALETTLVRDGASAAVALQQAAALARHSLHPVSRALVEAAGATGAALAHVQWHASDVKEQAGAGVSGRVGRDTPPAADAAHVEHSVRQAGQGDSLGAIPETYTVDIDKTGIGDGVVARDTAEAVEAVEVVEVVEAVEVASPMRLGSDAFCDVSVHTLAHLPADCLHVNLSDSQGWLATFVLREHLREDAQEAVRSLQRTGLRLQVLSGDRPQAVRRIAEQLGISDYQGACSANDKLSLLRDGQRQGHHVAMVGDGINDGPVLAGAHVSFALGKAVPLAQAQSDFVVLGSSLQAVSHALLLARHTMAVVRQNLLWAAMYNVCAIPLAIAGMVPAWLAGLGMAGSSLLVVLNAMRLARSRGTEPARAASS